MSKKSKLHELLAVEGDLKGTHEQTLAETINTFTKKADLFSGHIRKMEWLDADEQEAVDPDEHKHMSSTIQDKLDYQAKSIVRYFDALLQKEATNQEAKSDVVIDGVTILEAMPATFLLGMESRLAKVREVYAAIPTLAPGVEWREDETKGNNVYSRVHPEENFKTKKETDVNVLYPHKFPKEGEKGESLPAQLVQTSVTKNVAILRKHVWSGLIHPVQKSEMLERIDKLIRAVKKARTVANATEVVKLTAARKMFVFIHGK